MTTPTGTATQVVHKPRVLVGRVVSDRMQKTVTVLVERKVKDPLMGKIVTRSKKYHAHVAEGGIGDGDWVEIIECKPISKTKSWKVVRLIQKSRKV
jgi:small subunit ribosomal protein S17